MTMQRLLTKKDVEDLLAMKERTINNLMANGELPYIKIGKSVRFDPKDVEEFVARQKRTGEPGKQSPA